MTKFRKSPTCVLQPSEKGPRELLGMPDGYVDVIDWADIQVKAAAMVRNTSVAPLAEIVESPTASLRDRIAAGSLLAVLGDPRCRPGKHPYMISIPGGPACIGLSPSELESVYREYMYLGVERTWIAKEVPAHSIDIDPFEISKYPVTNDEYRAFLAENPDCPYPTSWKFGRYPQEFSNHPVYSLSAGEAEQYIAWLSHKVGRQFRLPSEVEWEYAAGAGRFEFPWGNEFLFDHANTAELKLLTTTPVGSFPKGKSPFGAMDMAGNVEEYVRDDYRPYPGGDIIIDDLNRDGKEYRIARGGSFSRFCDLARVKRRHGRFSHDLYAVGFRVAADVVSSPSGVQP
jgi:toxoflavin biosynthesis protein ToxD